MLKYILFQDKYNLSMYTNEVARFAHGREAIFLTDKRFQEEII